MAKNNLFSAITGFAVFLLMAGGCLTSSSAQSRMTFGGFISPLVKFTSINKQSSVLAGADGIFLIDGKFGIGGAVYGLVSTVDAPFKSAAGRPYSVFFNYGGTMLEYRLMDGRYSASVNVLFAGGGIKLRPPESEPGAPSYYGKDMLLWEPAARIGCKLSEYLSVDGIFSYRFINAFDDGYGFAAKDFTGYNIAISLRAGN